MCCCEYPTILYLFTGYMFRMIRTDKAMRFQVLTCKLRGFFSKDFLAFFKINKFWKYKVSKANFPDPHKDVLKVPTCLCWSTAIHCHNSVDKDLMKDYTTSILNMKNVLVHNF